MKLEVDRDWFVRRAELEGDHEIGAGGTGGVPHRSAPPQVKAMLLAMAAVPAAACLQILALIAIVGSAGEGVDIASMISGTAFMLVPAMVLAYVIGALPTVVGALLIYPVLQANHSALTEYLLAAVLGGLVLAVHAAIFLKPGLALLWMVGVLPAMAGVYVYRIFLPRAAA